MDAAGLRQGGQLTKLSPWPFPKLRALSSSRTGLLYGSLSGGWRKSCTTSHTQSEVLDSLAIDGYEVVRAV